MARRGAMGGSIKNEPAEKRGYTYRLTRRQFLVASSAAALAACGPAALTPSASPSASPGKELKIGVLLPFTGVYAELGNSMRRATELYLNQNDRKIGRASCRDRAESAEVDATAKKTNM